MSNKLTKQEFTQPIHCCGPKDADTGRISLELYDGGGGEYLVINATEWAVDSIDEINQMVEVMRRMLPQ